METSFVNVKFCQSCVKRAIILSCLPAHSTRFLQPLDVGLLFHLCKRRTAKLLGSTFRRPMSTSVIGSSSPLRIRRLKHERTYTKAEIESDFRKTGIVLLTRARGASKGNHFDILIPRSLVVMLPVGLCSVRRPSKGVVGCQ